MADTAKPSSRRAQAARRRPPLPGHAATRRAPIPALPRGQRAPLPAPCATADRLRPTPENAHPATLTGNASAPPARQPARRHPPASAGPAGHPGGQHTRLATRPRPLAPARAAFARDVPCNGRGPSANPSGRSQGTGGDRRAPAPTHQPGNATRPRGHARACGVWERSGVGAEYAARARRSAIRSCRPRCRRRCRRPRSASRTRSAAAWPRWSW